MEDLNKLTESHFVGNQSNIISVIVLEYDLNAIKFAIGLIFFKNIVHLIPLKTKVVLCNRRIEIIQFFYRA